MSAVVEVAPQKIVISVEQAHASITVDPRRASVKAKSASVDFAIGNPIVREFIGGEPYEGEYTVIPLAGEAVVLPTTNKLLYDDVTVTKVPYYETSNTSGTTVYIASEV